MPFPTKIERPELPVGNEILGASAERLRRALGTLRPLRPPPPDVLDAFGIDVGPTLLKGGRGDSWATPDVVLKPVDDDDEASWIASLAERLPQEGFRLARPLRTTGGEWVARGWSAWQRLDGEPRADRWEELLAAADAFHAGVALEPKPAFIDRRTDRWRTADRIAWGEITMGELEGAPHVGALLAAQQPVRLRAQVIHGDLVGNVLFANGLPPAIIDLSLYWRPRGYSAALVVGDALAWEGAEPSIVRLIEHIPQWEQLLLRAVTFRVIVSELARRAEPWRNDLAEHYAPLVERTLRFVSFARR